MKFDDQDLEPIVIANVELYQELIDPRQRFKYYTVLAKSRRAPQSFLNVQKISCKCVFFSHSRLPQVSGQNIYLACGLLNHALDGNNQVF